jgi:hypothetical protein
VWGRGYGNGNGECRKYLRGEMDRGRRRGKKEERGEAGKTRERKR